MRRFVYFDTARADLLSIADYYGTIDPEVADRILADIESTIAELEDFPHRGRRIAGRELHRILSRRYRFKIAYRVTEETIEIIGIFRFQNREA